MLNLLRSPTICRDITANEDKTTQTIGGSRHQNHTAFLEDLGSQCCVQSMLQGRCVEKVQDDRRTGVPRAADPVSLEEGGLLEHLAGARALPGAPQRQRGPHIPQRPHPLRHRCRRLSRGRARSRRLRLVRPLLLQQRCCQLSLSPAVTRLQNILLYELRSEGQMINFLSLQLFVDCLITSKYIISAKASLELQTSDHRHKDGKEGSGLIRLRQQTNAKRLMHGRGLPAACSTRRNGCRHLLDTFPLAQGSEGGGRQVSLRGRAQHLGHRMIRAQHASHHPRHRPQRVLQRTP